MLQHPTLEKAAAAAEISTVTAGRITRTAEFREEFREAQQQAFAQSMARMQHHSGAAVSTTLRIMAEPQNPPVVRLRAADRV